MRRLVSIVASVAVSIGGLSLMAPAAAEPDPSTEPDTPPSEVMEERTETTQVFRNADGTRTATIHAAPVRLKQDGEWVPVDYTLERRTDGTIAPKAAPAEVTIGRGGTKDAARVELGDGGAATLSWPAVLPEPKLEGQSAVYKVSASTDLIVAVTGQGVATYVRLNSAPAADDPSWRLGIRMDGIDVDQDTASTLSFTEDGRKVGDVAHMVAWDAARDGEGDPVNLAPVTADLTDLSTIGNTTRHDLELAAPESFLDDPETEYPVIIDPDINAVSFLRDIWVRYGTGTNFTAESSEYRLLVGEVLEPEPGAPGGEPNHNPARTLLAWNNAQLAGKTIVSAEMGIYQYGANRCEARTVEARPLTGPFNGETTHWGNQPSFRSTEGTSTTFNPGGDGCGTSNAFVKFDVKAMAQKWASGAYPNHGVVVKAPASVEAQRGYGRRFCSSQPNSGIGNAVCKVAGRTPYLKIRYNGPPGLAAVPATPTTTVNGVVTTRSSKPTWTTSATDAEASAVKYEVQVHSSTAGTTASLVTSCVTALVKSGTAASCTPTGTLNDKTTYYARARAIDQYNVPGTFSGYRQVRVDLGPPATAAVPTTPTTTVNGVETTSSSTPPWTSKATAPAGRVRYDIQVHSSTAGDAASLVTSCSTAQVTSGTAATCTPTGTLTNGATYYARAKGVDQHNVSGPWSGYKQVRVDTGVAPPAEVVELYDEVGARKGATRQDFPIGDQINASVDVGTGNLLVLTDDLKLPGIGGDVQLGLDYNSLLVGSKSSAAVGSAGAGWQMRLGQDTRLIEKDNFNVAYLAPGGLQAFYENQEGTDYDTPDGWDNELKKTDNGWTLHDNKSRTDMSFNTGGLLASITDKNNQDIDFAYDSGTPRKLTAISATRGTDDGKRARFEFTGNVVTRMFQSVEGTTTRQVTYTYDNTTSASPLLTRITDTLGRQTNFAYDSSKRLSSITNTQGTVTTFEYNANNKVTKVVRDAASGGIQATTRFNYTDEGNTLVADPKTDPNTPVGDINEVTTYNISPRDPSESDKAGPLRVKKVRDQRGRERGKTYTSDHDVETTTSPMGDTSNFSYGTSSGQSMTGAQSPTGAKSSTGYGEGDDQFSPTSMVDAEERTSSMGYDENGNQTSAGAGADEEAARADVEYFKNEDDPDYTGDEPKAIGDGLPKSATSPGGEETTFDRNSTTHQITGVDPESDAIGASTLDWDRYGRMIGFVDGRNKRTDYTYDDADRITKVTYSDDTPDVTYTYDAAGNMATRVDGTGTTTYGYDNLRRLASRTSPGAGGQVAYTYDKAGNLTRTTDAAGTTTYGYDAANQLQTQITSSGKRVEYSYDDDGNRTNIWFDTNNDNTAYAARTHNDYDKNDRLIRTWTSKNSSEAAADRVFDTSYCYAKYVPGEECPTEKDTERDTSLVQYSIDHNRTVGDADDRRTEYTYDSRGRLTGATNYQGLTDYAYTYDADSNLKTIVEGADDNGPEDKTFEHNAVNQLTNEGYEYDKSGNRTRSAGDGAMEYDGANRMTKFISTRTGGANVTYTWAGADMTELVGRSVSNGNSFGYTYGRGDSNGLPLMETFTKTTSSTGAQRWGIDYDNTGSPIALLSPGGTEHYFVMDRQATSVALINAQGEKSGDYRYSPYGEVKDVNGTADAVDINFYRHTLGFTDTGEGTGFVKHGVRFNDTKTGTWTTQDPMNAALDLTNGNRYLYAGADPINHSDMTGYWAGDYWRFAGKLMTGHDVIGIADAAWHGDYNTAIASGIGAVGGSAVARGCALVAGVETFGAGLVGCTVGGAVAGEAAKYWAHNSLQDINPTYYDS